MMPSESVALIPISSLHERNKSWIPMALFFVGWTFIFARREVTVDGHERDVS